MSPDPDVAEEVLILKSARAQREARELADGGDFDKAQKLLRDSAKEIRGFTPYSTRADELIKEAEILEQHAEMAAPMSWDASSAKAMHYDSRRRHQSRRRKEPPQA